MDFAHLEAEIIAHVIARQIDNAGQYLGLLRASLSGERTPTHTGSQSLLATTHEIAGACLGNPTQSREYELALYLSCLGALKYRNLDSHQQHFLYLTASLLAQRL